MLLQTAPDINVQITVIQPDSPTTSSSTTSTLITERRVTPSWTVSQLKTKLEPITGIPSSSQTLRTYLLDGTVVTFSDETSLVGDPRYGLRKASLIEIIDSRPPALRGNFTDVSAVDKYEMPVEQYERLDDTVLAWKRRQKLGRFDPTTKSVEDMIQERRDNDQHAVQTKGIQVTKRCCVGNEDTRRGTVRFVGEIQGLGGEKEIGCVWVGVELDEPVGRNDGSVQITTTDDVTKTKTTEKKSVFECRDKFGVFARPEKIEIGDFPPLDDLMDEDMEEL